MTLLEMQAGYHPTESQGEGLKLFPREQVIYGVEKAEIDRPAPLNWGLPAQENEILRGNSHLRRTWLKDRWREAQPFLESGSSIKEVIENARVTDPDLGRSLKISFALRTTFAQARQISTGAQDSQPDGWQMLYSDRAYKLGLSLNPDRPGREEQNLALSIVREKRQAMQEVLNILPESDRDPLLVARLLERAAQQKLEQQIAQVRAAKSQSMPQALYPDYRGNLANRRLKLTLVPATLLLATILPNYIIRYINEVETKANLDPYSNSVGALIHSLWEILRGI